MNIDLKPLLIGENERVRWCTVLDCEAPATEDISQLWYVGDGDNDVDVSVTSSLPSQERVDSPSTVELHIYRGFIKQTEQLSQIGG
jgi:hypothetical protein